MKIFRHFLGIVSSSAFKVSVNFAARILSASTEDNGPKEVRFPGLSDLVAHFLGELRGLILDLASETPPRSGKVSHLRSAWPWPRRTSCLGQKHQQLD